MQESSVTCARDGRALAAQHVVAAGQGRAAAGVSVAAVHSAVPRGARVTTSDPCTHVNVPGRDQLLAAPAVVGASEKNELRHSTPLGSLCRGRT